MELTTKRYPSYKDSGVEWIGNIPSHWKVERIKHTSYVKGRIGWHGLNSEEFVNEGPFLVTGTDFVNGRVNWDTCYHVSEERYRQDPYIILKNGDLLITKDGTIGKLAIVDKIPDKAALNSGIFVTRSLSNTYTTDFLYWVLSSRVFSSFINFTKTGTTINHLYQEAFTDFSFPFPSLPEQRAIADFLDRETARIDALIAKYQRLIELLEEKRTSLISQAVTKGLDASVEMKDSGVEWLGKIPVHWSLLSLRRGIDFLTDFEANGSFSDLKEKVVLDEGEPFAWYVRATDLENKRIGINDSNRYCDNETYNFLRKTKLFGGELLVAKRGEIGKVYVLPQINCPATLAPNLYLIRLNKKLFPLYVYYWFVSVYGKKQLTSLNFSTTIGALYKDDIKNCPCLFPPFEEQCAIVDFLDHETSRIDSLKGQVMGMITRLQEYRTTLISTAVTGKIDVRN